MRDCKIQFPKVLIVDDETITLDILEIVLNRLGYQVLKASEGHQAIQILNSENFDLVITDFELGDMDGMSILEKAKELNPLTPVIMITGNYSINTAFNACRRGVDDYLLKPFTEEELSDCVTKAFDFKMSIDN